MSSMAWEADHYTVDEAAHVLGLSPARVRQLLRAGELEGQRGGKLAEGVPGPWRISVSAVHAFRDHLDVGDPAETTVALPPEGHVADVPEPPPGETTADPPSETSERLSEGVSELRKKAEELLGELERLEGRLEAAEIQEIALREELRREKESSAELRSKLEAVAPARRRGEPRGSWRRLLGE